MTIALSGSSGFVGSYLYDYFEGLGYSIIAIDRDDFSSETQMLEKISGADIIINLVGATILKRWSRSYKEILYSSRIETTNSIVKAINSSDREQIFISTSAIGIYENDTLCDEDNYTYGTSYLTDICRDWEIEAHKANARVSIFRLSLILGDGGALQKMLLPFKLGVGGIIGDGTQPLSFVHISDLARAYEWVIKEPHAKGLFNLSTPQPTTNYHFTQVLATKLNRPAFIPLPAFILKALLGEGATILIDGQRVYPKRLLESGFEFEFQGIEEVLEDLI
ncbi:MAG: TIGR01777 family protein [Epsilonproteobacteria bacterium]|nr:MAG: TIGR01777 family protein [Campylobacterota bacterium]